MSTPGYLTMKQYQILSVLCDGNGNDEAGNFIAADLDELLERLAYRTTKDSIQFSIRPLVNNGFLTKSYEKRRNARRVVLTPTKMCRQIMGRMTPAFFEPADFEKLDV